MTFADGPLEVRWKGQLLSYRISKDQRVSHTAIVENKRLRHALGTVKSQQDDALPHIMTKSAKNGYQMARLRIEIAAAPAVATKA